MDYFVKLAVTFEMEIMMNYVPFSLLCFIKLIRDDAWSEVNETKDKKRHRKLLFLTDITYTWN